MATLSVTKSYKRNNFSANVVVTFTYTISNSDTQTTLSPSSLNVTLTTSGTSDSMGIDQLNAINDRDAALKSGIATTVAFGGTTFVNISVKKAGAQTISTTARSVNKTHSAQTATLSMTVGGVNKTASIAVPAKTSYAVTFNANSGSGGVTSGTKWHGETLTLPTTNLPTRTGYHFKGWGTSSGATETQTTYTGNSATTFYAVWERWISGSSIATIDTIRVADTSSTVEDDEGTVCYGTFQYVIEGAAAANIAYSVTCDSSTPVITMARSSANKLIDETFADNLTFYATGCDASENYKFTVTATATNSSVTQTAVVVSRSDTLSTAYYPMDVLGDAYWDSSTQTGERPGHGIAFGGPAKNEGFRVYMPSNFDEPIESGIANKGAIQWIGAALGTAAVYVPKKEGDMSNVVASLVMETSGGGAWIISNYADEYLRLSYVTGADRSSGNNNAVHPIVLHPDGTVAYRGDVGWTNLPLGSAVEAFSSGQTPQYRRVGQVVNLVGACKNKAQLASNGTLTLGTLPAGCRPHHDVIVLCQGSSQNKWCITASASGAVTASRYSTGGTLVAAAAGTWIPFNITFLV